jgi:uncharacterized protein YrzB (UPF0473 family)
MSEKELEYNPDLYTLVDEEGNEQVFELLDIMEIEDDRYFALIPYFENPEQCIDDEGELIVLKSQMQGDEEMMITIDDDDEYERVGKIFIEKLSEIFESEDV